MKIGASGFGVRAALIGMFAVLLSARVEAVACTEAITAVIAHSNGNVYFTTSGTCSVGWCQASTTGNAASNMYAMFLAAVSQGKQVYLSWPNLTSCSQQNVLYAVPDLIAISP